MSRSTLARLLVLALAGCGGPAPELPVAKAGGPRTAEVGEAILFDGTKSLHAVTFHWEFGDNAVSDEAKAEHAYAAPGTYTAVLTVRNSAGGSNRDTAEITVTGAVHNPPTAKIAGPTRGRAGEALSFDGSGSSGAAAISDYAWNFGDGGTATGATATHLFAANGQYAVQLTVRDVDGLEGATSVTVTIGADTSNRPPVAVPGHDVTARVGEKVSLDGSASFDPDSGDAITAFDWDFGDDAQHATIAKPDHTWTLAGTYTITLKVTDAHATTGQATSKATILPPADYTGRWTLTPDKASVSCSKVTIPFPAQTLDLTHSGATLTAQDPSVSARRLTGAITGQHFSTTATFSGSTSCGGGTATVTETFSGDFSSVNDKALAGSYAVYHKFSDLTCNCSATFSVTGARP